MRDEGYKREVVDGIGFGIHHSQQHQHNQHIKAINQHIKAVNPTIKHQYLISSFKNIFPNNTNK